MEEEIEEMEEGEIVVNENTHEKSLIDSIKKVNSEIIVSFKFYLIR